MQISIWLYGRWLHENDFKNKQTKKPWIWSIPPPPTIHNFTLKVLDFQKFQSHFWNDQYSMARQIPASGGAQVRDKRSTLARSKEEKLNAHTTYL